MKNMDVVEKFRKKFKLVSPHLNEKTRRIWTATEAKIYGYGGITILSEATGLSRDTISFGLKELKSKNKIDIDRIRKSGAGRKKLVDIDKTILNDLEALLEPATRGDPESVLRWTCKSTKQLANELNKKGYRISDRKICDLLSDLGYSLQANRKTNEGKNHPDRDAQFLYIYKKVKNFQRAKQPVISVDTKKKELVGNYKNQGKEWNPKLKPIDVDTYDFPDPNMPKAAPYGVYDITKNEGWVSVGISSDTAEFAVATINKWWINMGKNRYPNAKKIYITSDCGGSNSRRSRLWKMELQKLADKIHIDIHVSHFPPGTSKWNKIEHKMFSFISINWRGRPLTTYNVIVNLISNTKTKSGLEIRAELDENKYAKGIKIADDDFKSIKLKKCKFHGEWNYIIKSRN
jgi:transposase